jgi:NTP pyrophosphatase (non-canonical NTP hydrolase)
MIGLPKGASMAAYQQYIHDLESLHGWLDVDLVHNCFLMGEEVGELFKAVRRVEKFYEQGAGDDATRAERVADAADEIVDVLNYLLAIANRLDIDVEEAFRAKNLRNQTRTWS